MDAGIAIFRDEWKDSSEYEKMSHLVFHAGYHSSVHKHADDLSFAFNSLGEDILIDPGKYTYSDNVFGNYFRSSKAHNTITVDNKSYDIKGSEKYGTAIKDHKLTDDYAWITAEHSLFKGVTVSRTMLYIKPNVIILFDSLNSSTNHSYQQVLNLGKNFEIDSKNATSNSVEAYIPGKDITLNIEQLAGAESLRSFKGHHDESDKVNPVRGFASPNTDQLYEMYQLEFEKSGKNTEFVTVLSVDSSEYEQMATDIEVMQSGKSIQVSYNLNGLKQSINIPLKK